MHKNTGELLATWSKLPYARMLAITLAIVCILLRNETVRLNQKLEIKEDTITALRINRVKEILEYRDRIFQKREEEYMFLLERLKMKEERERKLDSILVVNYEYLKTRKIK